MEIWKDVLGYEGLYVVSSLGRVKSVKTGLIRKHYDEGHGYKRVSLCKNRRYKLKCIHRLVVEAFIGAIPKGLEVNHKDEDKSNNTLDNLEICTRQYNAEYSCAKHYIATHESGEVVEIFNLRKFCRERGLSRSSMTEVAQGKRSQHKGWVVRYA
jgi:hypothetical protein